MKKSGYGLTEHRKVHVLKEEGGRYQVSPEPRNPGDVVIHGDAAPHLSGRFQNRFIWLSKGWSS